MIIKALTPIVLLLIIMLPSFKEKLQISFYPINEHNEQILFLIEWNPWNYVPTMCINLLNNKQSYLTEYLR